MTRDYFPSFLLVLGVRRQWRRWRMDWYDRTPMAVEAFAFVSLEMAP